MQVRLAILFIYIFCFMELSRIRHYMYITIVIILETDNMKYLFLEGRKSMRCPRSTVFDMVTIPCTYNIEYLFLG